MTGYTYKLAENEKELKDAFEVRRRVFTEEQGIPQDRVFDGCEDEATHIIAKDGERVIGTARVRFLPDRQAKLERMAVLKPFRGKGVGEGIMSFLAEELKRRQIERVILHAQHDAIGFYKACGYKTVGRPFREVGIEHFEMERNI